MGETGLPHPDLERGSPVVGGKREDLSQGASLSGPSRRPSDQAPAGLAPCGASVSSRGPGGRRIVFSFSAGESSGDMVVRGKAQLRPDDQAIFLIANTGEEDERALIFADRCDRHYGLNLVWVEAVIDPRPRAVTTHRVVTFETATRGPALFEAMCAKYGLPGPGFLHCTRELKTRAMDSYLRSIGWARGTYTTCIGIRADEMDRIDPDFRRKRYAYPLASAGVRKPDVHAAWDARPFQLGMREHEGNCRWCWKKSLRKHLTLAVENPAVFETPRLLERTYPEAGAGDQVRRLFRQRRTTDDLFALAAQPFEPFVDQRGKGQVDLLAPTFDAELDLGGSCGESCEAFGDERSPSLEAAE